MASQVSQSIATYPREVSSSAFRAGIISALITACIWSSWLISVKLGTITGLTTFDFGSLQICHSRACFLLVLI